MLNVQAVAGISETTSADALIVGVFEDEALAEAAHLIDEALAGVISTLINDGDFSGASSDTTVLYTYGRLSTSRVVLVGLGKREAFNIDGIRSATARAIKHCESLKLRHVAMLIVDEQLLDVIEQSYAMAEGAGLALYSYHGQKSSETPNRYLTKLDIVLSNETIVEATQSSINAALHVVNSVFVARDLVNLPPNYCTPEYMAAIATQVASESGLTVAILDEHDMRDLHMGALLAVAQGSSTPPCFIVLEHHGQDANAETIVLVGKGVTFDTGGYTIKSRDGLVGMKGDMGGGAAVIGAMRAIGMLKLPINVVGLVPCADNMISGEAYRPNDVFTASNGTTIEIISTDAEGRMLLADALVYAQRYNPDVVIDIATLTGASVVALGGIMAGLFTESDDLCERLVTAGNQVFERVWPLPIDDAYNKSLRSETADTKNSGVGRGGASVAAMFLKNFVDFPQWAHIDMAGVEKAREDFAYNPKSKASGFGVRLLTQFVRNRSDNNT